ncbi:right-handed parallel beta-helix repeat-containing protein [Methanobrevibacter sp.]|uniref:right-handed parallel beta-helix repeat-containing protein n=1 Tax=Methanobrevibacter sp. TaxID=66852 RepID=UPI002E799CEB|nr:right-handed parallel beta-helix repeat-containing protein [Methanobrevibacter sp.]MEE0939225.1 hypothetical protein [Methanobrevibacter sp.]
MIICIFSITSVSASDLNATDVSVIDDIGNVVSVENENNEFISIDENNSDVVSLDKSDELGVSNDSNILSTIRYVNPGDNIESAISAANSGDTLIVRGGTYVIWDYRISKSLTIIGENNPILTTQQRDDKTMLLITADLTLKNLILQDARAQWGSACYVSSGLLTVDNCTFKNNRASKGGGGILADDNGRIKVSNSHFSNCYGNYGGGIRVETTGEIINCTFEGCSAGYGGAIQGYGGAIQFYKASSSKVENCSFKYCNADHGGVIHIEGSSNIKILNSRFVNCKSSAEGNSAIDTYNSNYIYVDGCEFAGCSGLWGPIGFWGTVNNIYISDSQFSDCTSSNKGGAVYWDGGNTLNVNNCNFTNVHASSYGGAIYSQGGNYLKIKDSYFEKCQAHTYGGAMDISGVKDVNIIDCDFYECFTDINDGGAISSDSCTNVNILGCDFDSCKSNGFGGSVRVVNTGNLLTISDCNFSDSYSNIEGGSVYSRNVPNVIIDNCDFLNSSSNLTGGSVFILTTTNANLNDLYFKDSDSGNFAGSLFINDVTNFNLSNSEFINSHAKMTGGAIHVNPATNLNISDCLFDSCSAELYGNSLDIGFTKNTIIKNSNFTNSNYNGQEAITFPGSEKYEIVDSIFDVAPKDVICHYNTILSADDLSIVNGEQCTIRATLSNVAGPLSNKIVTFSVNGNSYSRTTSSDGVVSFNANDYIGGLGNHEVIVSYEGDSVNNAVSQKINVKVNMYRATLNLTQSGKNYYNGGKSLSFKVVDFKTGNVRADVPIHADIYLNGKLYKTVDNQTGGNGILTYSMTSFEPGNYSVKAYVDAQNVDVNAVEQDNIVISKISGVIELSTSNNNKTLNVKLVNPANGDVYEGIPVKLQFNPNGYETTVTTDSSDCVSVPLMFDLGTYGVVASVDSNGFKEFPIAELQNIVISTAGKDDSVVKFNNAIVFDYLKSGSTTLTLEGCTVTREKVSVDNHPEASIVVSGNKITVSGLAAGSYTLRVVSTPDQYHNSVTRTVGITVNKVDSAITIAKPVSFSYGESGSTNVNVNGGSVDYNGVSVDNHPEAFIGVVNNAITVSNLPVGSYTLRITSTPDSNHKAVTKTTTITVSKVDSKISFDKAISFVYGKSGSSALTLTGCSVVREGVSVDGHPEAVIDVNNNVVSVSNLSVGGYTLRITSVPDSNHNAVTNTIVVTVSKADSDVKFSKAISYDYGGSGSATLTMTGCSVTLGNIKVDNHPEAVIRLEGNVVSVSNLPVGSYTLRITSTPDSNHNAVTRTVGVTVNKASSKVGFSNPIEFDYLGSGSTTLILGGCTVSLSNVKVIGHNEALVSISNNNVVSISGLNAGNYTLRVESTPDENHRSAVATLPVTVNKLDSDIVFIKDSISFKYSKSGSTPIVLDNCKVASMSIEGQSVKPVLKGNVISVSGLPVGKYRLKVTTQPVNGNYNSVVRSIPVVVSKNTAKITVKEQTFAYKKAGKWAITLKDSTGKAISKVKVTLKVYTGKKAKAYSSTATNSKGVAYFNKIKELTLGNHKVVVSFSHKGYKCKAVSSFINVIKQTPVKFKIVPKSNLRGFTISVIVVDKSGKKFVNGVKVKLTVGSGKNKKALTLVSGNYGKGKGVCAYATNMMPAGTHKVTVTSAVVNYAGSASSKVSLKASAKKIPPWWEIISNGKATSHGLK